MTWTLASLLFGVALLALGAFLRAANERRTSRERLYSLADEPALGETPRSAPRGLARWLYLAGYRQAHAAAWFLGLTAATILLGIAGGFALWKSGLLASAVAGLDAVPGGVGQVFLPGLYLGPWFVLALLALSPTLVVRRARRHRVAEVERDLPVTLELLATLSESGLGFDAALGRLQHALPARRVLAAELRSFQADLLSGRPRVECLRRLSWRLDVPGMSILVSALIQAEQIGAGVSRTLRQQSDDLRNRRRERATELAMALPVKLMFPLVVCFLPGIFVYTLGPTFYQFFQFADTIVRVREF